MSNYAHNVLAPKLTSDLRGLLFKYFTTLLSDGFETSVPPNFDATIWTVDLGGAGTCVSENVNPHSGTINLKAITSVNGDWGQVTYSFVANDPTYVRAYFKIASVAVVDNDHYITLIDIATPAYTNYTSVAIFKSGGVLYWALTGYQNSVFGSSISDLTPTTNVWHCVEIKRDVANDVMTLTINEVLEVNWVTVITVNPTLVSVGICYQQGNGNCTVYVDDVVIADVPIGPMPEASKPKGTIAIQAELMGVV